MKSSVQAFGSDMFQYLCKDTFDKNIIFSPLSIYMALGMTLYGAKGDTSKEMMKVLHWDHGNPDSFHKKLSDCIKTGNVDVTEKGAIKIANKLYLESHFKLLESYTGAMDALYCGAIEKLDFQGNAEKSRNNINSWVEKQTNGKIKDLIQSGQIHKLTRLILVNAIYFKGSWQDKFSLIGQKSFHLLNGSNKQTEMMSKTSHYGYVKNDKLGFSAVHIPFKFMENNEYSLMIILPHKPESLSSVEKSIFQHEWKSIFGDNLFKSVKVEITMPKFRIECSFKLKDQLTGLGMANPFSGDADFSLMTGDRDLIIDEVVHKAFIDVNEFGVEAAAATAVMMELECCMQTPEAPIKFTCDHPFMFSLVKQRSLPLFIGHFTQ